MSWDHGVNSTHNNVFTLVIHDIRLNQTHNHLVASLPSLPGFGFPLFFSTNFSLLMSSFSLAVAGYSRPSFSGRSAAV